MTSVVGEEAVLEPPRGKIQAMWRGFLGRCPACGRGRMFRAYLKVNDRCPACGEELHHQRADVSQYRLAAHLLLATATLAYVVWLERGSSVHRDALRGRAAFWIRTVATVLVALVFCQIGLGALVAGLRAGLVFNTWPLMDGGLAPALSSLAFLRPAWTNLFENVATVQFEHRTTAYLLLLAAVMHAMQVRRLAPGTPAAHRAFLLAGLVLCQATIGIVTLVYVVPLLAALAHQAFAMVVLVAAVAHRRALGQPAARA